MLVVVLVGWVFFRALTLDQALDMLTRMFGLQPGSETMLRCRQRRRADDDTDRRRGFSLLSGLAVRQGALERVSEGAARQLLYGLVRAGFVGAITLLCIATMAVDQNNPFIYFRF